MDVEIISVATATPPHRLDQGDALTMVQRICCVDERQSRLATALYKHSGVQNRHTAVPYTDAYRWVPERNPDEAPEPNFGPTTEERMALYEAHALPLACEAATGALRRSKLTTEPHYARRNGILHRLHRARRRQRLDRFARAATHDATSSCWLYGMPRVD